jgi:integrase
MDPTIIQDFRGHLRRWGYSPNTVRAYVKDVQILFDEHVEADDPITGDRFCDCAAAYLSRSEAAPSTINRKLAAFNKFAEWAGLGDMGEFRRPAPPDEVHRNRIDIIEIRNIINSLDPLERSTYNTFVLCGMAGLRIAEAFDVEWDDFRADPDDPDTAQLIVTKAKGRKQRIVPISQRFYEMMIARRVPGQKPTGSYSTVDQLRYLVRKTGRTYGYDIESHDLRRAYAQAVYEATGHDLKAVQQLLGHTDISTTQRYINSTWEVRTKAAKAIA